MKIPEGWPTGRMCMAFEWASGVEMHIKQFDRGLRAAIEAAPKPPAQEVEPVGVVVRFSDGPWGEIHSEHRADIKQGTKLYTRPQSDELRIVIEEAVEILERYHEAGIVSKLLALLDP